MFSISLFTKFTILILIHLTHFKRFPPACECQTCFSKIYNFGPLLINFVQNIFSDTNPVLSDPGCPLETLVHGRLSCGCGCSLCHHLANCRPTQKVGFFKNLKFKLFFWVGGGRIFPQVFVE